VGSIDQRSARTSRRSEVFTLPYTSDRDGKSKTASAVDREHYPEQNEVDNWAGNGSASPTDDAIAIRAFELWHAKGCPDGTAEVDWFEAKAELQQGDSTGARHPHTGSVQH
jgi:hypothetical protein